MKNDETENDAENIYGISFSFPKQLGWYLMQKKQNNYSFWNLSVKYLLKKSELYVMNLSSFLILFSSFVIDDLLIVKLDRSARISTELINNKLVLFTTNHLTTYLKFFEEFKQAFWINFNLLNYITLLNNHFRFHF